MTTIKGEYKGDFECALIHDSSGTVIYTDAPAESLGKGRAFSPTDLIAAALGSCIATTLAYYAKRKGWNLQGLRFEVKKEMMPAPERRIASLQVEVWMPLDLSPDEKQACVRVGASCSVHRCIHPGIEVQVIYHWPHPAPSH